MGGPGTLRSGAAAVGPVPDRRGRATYRGAGQCPRRSGRLRRRGEDRAREHDGRPHDAAEK
uniref:Uncharacterized protein n=1 Tax=Dulem virus 38 TaxID=3145756 RepID=A0AAU8B0A9_9CAUD